MQAELTFENRIDKLVSPSLNDMGYEIVKITMSGDGSRKVLQVLVERSDGDGISIGDCEKCSHTISALLDVEESSLDKYYLEVSSPGIDRPLVKLKDFEKYKGYEAKFELFEKIEGQGKFRGYVSSVEGNKITVATNIAKFDASISGEPQTVEFDFNNIKNAKLILNDELLAVKKAPKG